MKSILADVNVWLATLVEKHPHHEAATQWWREDVLPASDSVAFCRLTGLGLLRLLSSKRVIGRQRLDHAHAWAAFKKVAAQASVSVLDEPTGINEILVDLCTHERSSPGFWSDAYLAAFARAGRHRFATFDRGFRQFEGLELLLLTS